MCKLLKLHSGTSKKTGKKYYMMTVLVGAETITTFIYQNQFNNIISSLSDDEKKQIIITEN